MHHAQIKKDSAAPTRSTSLLRLICATYDRSGRRARAIAITSTHRAGEGPSLLLLPPPPPPPLLLFPLPLEGEVEELSAPLVLTAGWEVGAWRASAAAEGDGGDGEGGAKQGRRGYDSAMRSRSAWAEGRTGRTCRTSRNRAASLVKYADGVGV